jgi:hypothetical protein
MHVLHVVGARPNFMKATPVLRALGRTGTRQTLVHTGQHYDTNMSEVFFRQLEMPEPDINLGVGSGSHAQQTATIMARLKHVSRMRCGVGWCAAYRQARGLDNLRPNVISGMGRLLHGHGVLFLLS